jgi:hypothetical protein
MTDSVNNAPNTGRVWVPGKNENLNSTNPKKEVLGAVFLTFIIILIMASVGCIAYFGGTALATHINSNRNASESESFNEKIQGNTLSYTTPKEDKRDVFFGVKSDARMDLEQSWIDSKIGIDRVQIAGGFYGKTNVLLFDNKETFYQVLENRTGDDITLTLNEIPREDLEKTIVKINKIQFGDKIS